MKKYILRLDDACETMHWTNWEKIFEITDSYGIKPIIAVVPNNKDPKLMVDSPRKNFWQLMKQYQEKGYYIAMHGYDHVYITRQGGLVPINNKSEFAGLSKEKQREKIVKAWNIFLQHQIEPKIWVAPSHTFDEITLEVIKEETTIEIISDGIAYYPYVEKDFFWIPQQLWWYKEKKNGIWTICLHPNTMTAEQMEKFENIVREHHDKFCNHIYLLKDTYKNRTKSYMDRVFEKYFFLRIKASKSVIGKVYRAMKGSI